LEVAARGLQRCGAILRYGIAVGWCTDNQTADLRGILKTRQVQHLAPLSEAELPEFRRKGELFPTIR